MVNPSIPFPYRLFRRKNARHIRISVYPGGIVRVSAPKLLPVYLIERFLREKRVWVAHEIERMEHVPRKLSKKEGRDRFIANKEKALSFVKERVEYFNRHYGYVFHRVSVRDQHTRWGSCSRKGNLNFNYRIILLPPEIADYVIVHELCHLGEFNHSARFWSLVAQQIPDYARLRAALHTHTHTL